MAQRNASDDDPGADDIYQVGTVSNILQLLKLPDGTIKVLVEGGFRAAVDAVDDEGDFAVASVREIVSDDIPEGEVEGLLRSTNSQFEKYVNLSKKVPAEVLTSLTGIDEPGRLADTIAAHMSVDLEEKQRILEISRYSQPPRAPDGIDGGGNRPFSGGKAHPWSRQKADGEKPARVLPQ